jgi:hypothetical protein
VRHPLALHQVVEPARLVRAQRRLAGITGSRRAAPPERSKCGERQEGERAEPQDERMEPEARLQEDELAVAVDEIVDDLIVAVAGHQAFAHQQAQVAGERRVGIVDRLVLAHEAADVDGYGAGPGLELGIAQHLVGLHGKARAGGERQERKDEQDAAHRLTPRAGSRAAGQRPVSGRRRGAAGRTGRPRRRGT